MNEKKLFRRIINLELVHAPHIINDEGTSYLVQNEGNKNGKRGTWQMEKEEFDKAFEPVSNADYTILTKDDRKVIRSILSDHLQVLAEKVAKGEMTPEQLVKTQTKVSANVGEKHKTMQEKFDYVDKLIIKLKTKG